MGVVSKGFTANLQMYLSELITRVVEYLHTLYRVIQKFLCTCMDNKVWKWEVCATHTHTSHVRDLGRVSAQGLFNHFSLPALVFQMARDF
jgi:hypothetical protein